MVTRYTNIPDNKHRRYGGAYSVHDIDLVQRRQELICEFASVDPASVSIAEDIKQQFVDTYRSWMWQGFEFQHTDLYQHACFTQGTTESFAHFYLRYRDGHRLRLAKGEYFYHQMMKSLWYSDRFAWLDQDDIRAGDVVLISVPFSDTGDQPQDLDQILNQCERLGVPVMLDLAYLNITNGETFPHVIDLSRDCIKYLVTSLSKVFPVENLRIGLRLQKQKFEDQIYVVNEHNYNYINLLSAYVGNGMMQSFSPDFVFNRYRSRQLKLCSQLALDPSPCFCFGIDRHDRYPEYNRGGPTNRLCFSRVWDSRADQLCQL